MGWRRIVITQHSKLSYSLNQMIVQTNAKIVQIPISDIDLVVVLTSQAVLTSALISELAKEKVKLIFVDRAYQPICETVTYYPENRNRILLENQFNWDVQRKQVLWTKIVASKIQNQLQVLKNYHGSPEVVAAIEKDLSELELNDVSNREALVARRYFTALFSKDFTRRQDNAIDAALNYGYSILLSSIDRYITIAGYVTYLGIHHRSVNNSFNLGSDLMEPFRPFVDYWLAAQGKLKEFTPDIKYGLVSLLSLKIQYNGQKMLLTTAMEKHVQACLKYLTGTADTIRIEMSLTDEVPNHAIDDNV